MIECVTVSRGTQTPTTTPDLVSMEVQVPSPTATESESERVEEPTDLLVMSTIEKLDQVARQRGIPLESRSMLPHFVNSCRLSQQCSGTSHPQVHASTCSWDRYYHVLSLLINGHLYADYVKLAGMLGFPSCAGSTWQTILKRLEVHVSQLAEQSCNQ